MKKSTVNFKPRWFSILAFVLAVTPAVNVYGDSKQTQAHSFHTSKASAFKALRKLKKKGLEAQVIKKKVRPQYAVIKQPSPAQAQVIGKKLRQNQFSVRKSKNQWLIGPLWSRQQVSLLRKALSSQRLSIQRFVKKRGAGSVLVFEVRLPSAGDKGRAQKTESLVFGAPPPLPEVTETNEDSKPSPWASGGRVRFEPGYFPRRTSSVYGQHYLDVNYFLKGALSSSFDWRIGGQASTFFQTGDASETWSNASLEETYLGYRNNWFKFSVGALKVIWGNVYENSLVDRLARQELGRLILTPYDERLRSQWATRLELFFGSLKIDMAWVPQFQVSNFPEANNVWSPIDKTRGLILGANSSTLITTLATTGEVEDINPNSDAGGVRMTYLGKGLDLGLSWVQAPAAQPFYFVNPVVAVAVGLGADPTTALASAGGVAFYKAYPKQTVVAVDMSTEALGGTVRGELGWARDGLTLDQNFLPLETDSLLWTTSLEVFPGDGNNTLNLQVSGSHVQADSETLLPKDVLNFGGRWMREWDQGRWRGLIRFAVGVNPFDYYLGPSLVFAGQEPHEFSLSLHTFEGAGQSAGEFFQDNAMILVGWSAKY
ncbi:MAG: hypothetical protein H6626_02020 [Pseudobdellovibrionaceae bacterium]|nr:hypothetical protein [Bdellovibrionales bacterium]USN47890.1 MAG: hypothetical protein H6626_02020 [Pseudobdellovibrionaceae bacterium]